jgi:hypothetical protein
MIQIKRSEAAPASLAKRASYREQDVIDQLEKDGHNKCYLCEQSKPTSINVEHFVPHQGNKDLKFDWQNLFLSCYHCNNTKSTVGALLNPTLAEDRIEDALSYHFTDFPEISVVIEEKLPSAKAANTAALLNDIHFGKTPPKKLGSRNLRKLIAEKVSNLTQDLSDYLDCSPESEEAEVLLRKIKDQLTRASSFTAIKWDIMRQDFPQVWERVAEQVQTAL